MATTLRPPDLSRHNVGPHVLRSALREPANGGPTLLRQHTLRYEKQPRGQIPPANTDDEFDLGRFQRTLTDFHYRRRGGYRFQDDVDGDGDGDDPEEEELENGDFKKLASGEWATFNGVKFQKSKTARPQEFTTRAKKQPATARFTRSVSMRQVELPQRLKGILHNDTSAPAQLPVTNFVRNRPEPIRIPLTSSPTSPEVSPSQLGGGSFSAPSARSAPAGSSSHVVTRGSTTDLVRSRRFSESLSANNGIGNGNGNGNGNGIGHGTGNGNGNSLTRVTTNPQGKKGVTMVPLVTSPTDPSFATSAADEEGGGAHYYRPVASEGAIGNPRGNFLRQAPPARGQSGNFGKVSAGPFSLNATSANITSANSNSVPPHLLELLHKHPLRRNSNPPSFPGTSYSGPPFTNKTSGVVPKQPGWLTNRASAKIGAVSVSPNSVLLSQQEIHGVSGTNAGPPRSVNSFASGGTVQGSTIGPMAKAERSSGNWNLKGGGEGKEKRDNRDKGVDSRPLGNQRRWINMFAGTRSSTLKSSSKEGVLVRVANRGPELGKRGENGRTNGVTGSLNTSSGGVGREGGLEGRLMRVSTLGRVEMRKKMEDSEFSMMEEDGGAKFKRSWTSNGVLTKKGVWEEEEVWDGEGEEWTGRRVSGEIARGTESLNVDEDDFVPLCEIYVPPGKAMVYGLVDEKEDGGGSKVGMGSSKGERVVKVWGNGSVQTLESIGGTKGGDLGRIQVGDLQRERVERSGSKRKGGREGFEVERNGGMVANIVVEEVVERERKNVGEGEGVMEEIVMEELVVEEERKEEKREVKAIVEVEEKRESAMHLGDEDEEEEKGGSAMVLGEADGVDGQREEAEKEREKERVKEKTGEEQEREENGTYSTEERLEEIAVALAMAASMERETGVTEPSKTIESSLEASSELLGTCLETSVGAAEASLETTGVTKTAVKVSMEAVVTVETISKEEGKEKKPGESTEGEYLNFASLEEKESSSATVISAEEGFSVDNGEIFYSSMGLKGETSFEMLKIAHESNRVGDIGFHKGLQSMETSSNLTDSQELYSEDSSVSEKMPILVASGNKEEIAGKVAQETIKCLKCNETVIVPSEAMEVLKVSSTDLRRFPCSSCSFDHAVTCVRSEGKAYVALIIRDMGNVTPCEA